MHQAYAVCTMLYGLRNVGAYSWRDVTEVACPRRPGGGGGGGGGGRGVPPPPPRSMRNAVYTIYVQWPSLTLSRKRCCSWMHCTQRHREGRICVYCCVTEDLCIDSLSSAPSLPLSSATHFSPALDQLLPVQRFCDGTLSNHWIGCLSAPSVCMSVLQVVLCAQLVQHVCMGKSHGTLRLMSDGACMAVEASSGCRRYAHSFTALLLREKHIY